MVLIGGIDEAGRGPVVGPMVMVLAVVDEEKTPRLRELGVKDSKAVPPEKREEITKQLERVLDEIVIIEVAPQRIDEFVARRGLNELEAATAAELILQSKTRPPVVYVDAPDPNAERYAQRIATYLEKPPRIIAEHKADVKYPIVSAASIIAKVRRDALVRQIESEYGVELGTGYPHDRRTIETLENWVKRNRKLPPFARKSWSTARRILERNSQRSILDW